MAKTKQMPMNPMMNEKDMPMKGGGMMKKKGGKKGGKGC